MDTEARIVELEMRLAALERKVDSLMKVTQMPDEENHRYDFSEIRQLLSMGKKIEAIKRYREISGLGLREAKDMIDQLEREIRGR